MHNAVPIHPGRDWDCRICYRDPHPASARAAAEAAADIPTEASTMVAAEADIGANLPAKASARAAAEAVAEIPTEANMMGAAEAEVAANPPAKASARSTAADAAAVIPPKANAMGAAESEVDSIRLSRPAQDPLPRPL